MYAATLTIPGQSATLTDFVTRVDLAHMPAGWWSDVSSGGGNIRVKAAGSVIPFDLVAIDTVAGTGELFFKATLTTSSNTFTVETVDGATALAATDPNGRNAVWSDYDVFVDFHALTDRTGKGATVALQGSATLTADGWLDCGSRAGNAVITGLPSKRLTYTYGATGVPTGVDGNRSIASYSTNGSGNDRLSLLTQAGHTTPGSWEFFAGWLYGPTSIPTGDTFRAALTRNDATTTRTVFTNGAGASGSCAGHPTDSLPVLFVGAEDTDYAERWQGTLNHVYMRPEVLPAAWLAAESTSWVTPASFYAVTEPEGDPTGSFAVTLPRPTVALAGTAPTAGAMAVTLPVPTLALVGSAPIPGVLAVTLPTFEVAAAGTTPPARTGFGLVLDSTATVTAEPPLEAFPPSPGGVPDPVQHIITPTVPAPVLTNGRPQ